MDMESTNNEFEILLQKYADGQLSKQEFDLLLSYVRDSEHTETLDKVADRDWTEMGMEYPYSAEASEKLFENIKSDQRYTQGLERPENQAKVLRLIRWKRNAVAAAVATVIFGGGLFYYYSQAVKKEQITTYSDDVAPGRKGATLTLASGQKILINEALAGNIASQSGVKISKTADGQIVYEVTDQRSGSSEQNTLSTSPGEQTRVRLPDGSLVFLNAASSLKYPVSFSRSAARRVSLTGEGYFEISKSFASIGGQRTRQPFVVESRGQKVEVIGTHFNINSYADEPSVATTLLEGSVKVSQGGKDVILKPGQQAVNSGNAFVVSAVDTESITDWKDGDFYFEHVEFRSVMRKISRWYNVEVIYDASVPDRITSNGLISRNNKLSEVLKSIEKAGDVHFRIQGNKVYVTK
jgi:transmembrane sensor